MPKLLSVFLCYAEEDWSVVQDLYKAFKSQKWIEVKTFQEIITLPGQDWREIIEQIVSTIDVIVFPFSNTSVYKDGKISKEIRYAYDIALEKPVGTVLLIPLRLDDIATIPRNFRSLQWVDYFGSHRQEEYSKLLDSLYLRFDKKISPKDSPDLPSTLIPDEGYQIALDRIAHAKKTQADKLDLSGLKLSELPSGIGELINLSELNLSISSQRIPTQRLNVFLSHAREDRPIVKELYKDLKSESWINPWLDIEKLQPGEDWRNAIEQALNSADVVIICMSYKSVQKEGFIQKEIRYAYERALEKPEGVIFLIPLLLDDVASIPRSLRFFKSVVYFGNQKQDGYHDLLMSLRLRHEQDLTFNYLSSLPTEIGKLVNLTSLDLSYNRLKSLPVEILNLKSLKSLYLKYNLLSIPPEILEKAQEPQTILEYFFSRSNRALNECKVLVVGQGSVGKTSLIQRLIGDKFNPSESKTEGIAITRWKVESNQSDIEMTNEKLQINLNIWDFGGQEIMHATHQFFLTKRSLYLLILDSRLTQEENRVEYWLKIIQSFGGNSPVIVVGNKNDQHPLDIDRSGLLKKYPNVMEVLETSAATGNGVDILRSAIAEQIQILPHARDLLPGTWFNIKKHLEQLGHDKNFINHDEFLMLCNENEVSDETSQRTLIGFLHDLGVVLHFQDDPRLEALGILNPQWVTNGVYKILNSHALFQNKGVLTVSMLDEILNLPEYPRGKRLFIVDMMKKFELCYDIEPDKTFLVPDLLPKDEPDLNFNGVPAFEYAYPVLPSSVITRFIVRMNQKIDDGFVWRTGVVLKIGENKALVKADIEDRKITIAIDGVEHTRRDALSAIRYELGEIHNSIKGLNPQQRVPVPNAPYAEPLKYEYLLKLERVGQETVLVENGNDLVTVNVRQMLSAIESEAQRREQQGNIINNYYNASDGGIIVGRDLSGNLISGNNNKIIQDSYNKIQSADIDPELKQTLKSLTEAIATVVQSFPEEKTVKVVKNFERLADEVIQPEPDKQWYSVSIEGLIKAAENLDKLGTPVISLSRKVLSLLTGGVVK